MQTAKKLTTPPSPHSGPYQTFFRFFVAGQLPGQLYWQTYALLGLRNEVGVSTHPLLRATRIG